MLAKPEKVVAAAIRVNGKVITGPMHALALVRALEMGILDDAALNAYYEGDLESLGIEEGFVTTTGRFISREEAYELERARRASSTFQDITNTTKSLDSTDIL
jgi:hypothetical protein